MAKVCIFFIPSHLNYILTYKIFVPTQACICLYHSFKGTVNKFPCNNYFMISVQLGLKTLILYYFRTYTSHSCIILLPYHFFLSASKSTHMKGAPGMINPKSSFGGIQSRPSTQIPHPSGMLILKQALHVSPNCLSFN